MTKSAKKRAKQKRKKDKDQMEVKGKIETNAEEDSTKDEQATANDDFKTLADKRRESKGKPKACSDQLSESNLEKLKLRKTNSQRKTEMEQSTRDEQASASDDFETITTESDNLRTILEESNQIIYGDDVSETDPEKPKLRIVEHERDALFEEFAGLKERIEAMEKANDQIPLISNDRIPHKGRFSIIHRANSKLQSYHKMLSKGDKKMGTVRATLMICQRANKKLEKELAHTKADLKTAQRKLAEYESRAVGQNIEGQVLESLMNQISETIDQNETFELSDINPAEAKPVLEGKMYHLVDAMENYRAKKTGAYEAALALQEELKDLYHGEADKSAQLTKELHASRKEVAEAEDRITEAADQIRRLDIGATCAGQVALQALVHGKFWPNTWKYRDAANRAAHEGNILRDAALFSTGHIPREFGKFFEMTYCTKLEAFLGSFENLKPLQDCPKQVAMRNYRASVHAYLNRNERSKEKDPNLLRIEDLFSALSVILEELSENHPCQEDRDAAFEHHPNVDELLDEMKILVMEACETGKSNPFRNDKEE